MLGFYFLQWKFALEAEQHEKEIRDLVEEKTKKGIQKLFMKENIVQAEQDKIAENTSTMMQK